jgi:hypothetical protein
MLALGLITALVDLITPLSLSTVIPYEATTHLVMLVPYYNYWSVNN